MQLKGEQLLPVSQQAAWEALNDTSLLKESIPGCESIEPSIAEGESTPTPSVYDLVMVAAIGPVKATFKGRVMLSEIDAPNGYTISGEGQGGVAGFAKGGARVRLEEAEGGTRMTYDVEANVGGKLAQLGGRLINGVAKKYADEFFDTFAKTLAPQAAPAGSG